MIVVPRSVRRLVHATAAVALALVALLSGAPVRAADTLNVYSIWPENWARPMFEEFEKASGIKVNFVRFSSGEALARVIAEKNNPRVDVLFGGPVETFAAGIAEGVFEPYKPPTFGKLPARLYLAGWRASEGRPREFQPGPAEPSERAAARAPRAAIPLPRPRAA